MRSQQRTTVRRDWGRRLAAISCGATLPVVLALVIGSGVALAPNVARAQFERTTALTSQGMLHPANIDLDGHRVISGRYSLPVFVFERAEAGDTEWHEVARLEPDEDEEAVYFGFSMALSGDTMVVGDMGASAAYIIERNNETGEWTFEQKLEPAPGSESSSSFGLDVEVDGDVLVVSAPTDHAVAERAGAVFVYHRTRGDESMWEQAAILHPPRGSERAGFGWRVALDGDVLVVGQDERVDGEMPVYVFERHAGGEDHWGQAARLVGAGEEALSSFGGSLSVDADTLLVGAGAAMDSSGPRGRVYVYERSSEGWQHQETWRATDEDFHQSFGSAVSISGDLAAVTAREANARGISPAAVYIYHRRRGDSSGWEQVQLLSDDGSGAFYSAPVELEDTTLVIRGGANPLVFERFDTPAANPDQVDTRASSPVDIDVLVNDHTQHTEPLEVSITRAPSHGIAEVTADSQIHYVSDLGYSGQDSFEYEVYDGWNGRDTAEVLVSVQSNHSSRGCGCQPGPGSAPPLWVVVGFGVWLWQRAR